MLDPNTDKDVVQEIISSDSEILNLLDLESASNLEIAKHIIKRSRWDDLAGNDKRISIYFRPSRSTRNEITVAPVIQVDCHVPAKQDYIAEKVMKRVKILLHKRMVNNRPLYLESSLGELPTMPGFYCAGCRFYYYSII